MPDHPNLVTALIAAQTAMGSITKDKQAKVGAFSYAYADLPGVLEEVMPTCTRTA